MARSLRQNTPEHQDMLTPVMMILAIKSWSHYLDTKFSRHPVQCPKSCICIPARVSLPLSGCVWSRSKGCRTLSTTPASVQYANRVLGVLPLSSDETEEEFSSSDDDHLSPKALQDVFHTLEILHGWRQRVKTCSRGCPSPLAHICMQLGTHLLDQQFSVDLSSVLSSSAPC